MYPRAGETPSTILFSLDSSRVWSQRNSPVEKLFQNVSPCDGFHNKSKEKNSWIQQDRIQVSTLPQNKMWLKTISPNLLGIDFMARQKDELMDEAYPCLLENISLYEIIYNNYYLSYFDSSSNVFLNEKKHFETQAEHYSKEEW